jgi:hypothetical protein
VVRRIIIFNLNILLFAMTFIRYIFIFWLKNPAAFHDDFWLLFINLWSILFGVVTQLPRALVPGVNFTKIAWCYRYKRSSSSNPSSPPDRPLQG